MILTPQNRAMSPPFLFRNPVVTFLRASEMSHAVYALLVVYLHWLHWLPFDTCAKSIHLSTGATGAKAQPHQVRKLSFWFFWMFLAYREATDNHFPMKAHDKDPVRVRIFGSKQLALFPTQTQLRDDDGNLKP